MLSALLKDVGKNPDYTVTDDTLWDALMDDIAKVRDEIGEEIPLVISIRQAVKSRLEKNAKYQKVVNAAQFTAGKILTNLNLFDFCYLRPVPSARMKTAYVFRDGKSGGEENGGFAPDEAAKNINWIITPQNAPIAVTKQDKMKIYDPDTFQKADAWFIGYRRYHELWLPKARYERCLVNAEAVG